MTTKLDLEAQAKQAFDRQVDTLDAKTQHRLRLAREVALSKKQSWLSLKWLTAASAGLALAGVLSFLIVPSLSQSNSLSPLEDLEMLTADADLELYTQMDFYQWLDDSALSESTL